MKAVRITGPGQIGAKAVALSHAIASAITKTAAVSRRAIKTFSKQKGAPSDARA